jgi:putative FmdB family regulatory protein
MPIYEYVCDQCGKKTEVIQSFKQAPPKACPHCGGKLKKMHSAPAFHLKGSGWYKTDYAAKREAGGEKESGEKPGESQKAEKAEKSEKVEKTGTSEKSEKSEKPGKKKESKETKSSE